MSALYILIGLIIFEIELVHDYIQIIFSDSTILSIYNNYVYDGESILGIQGDRVKTVEESESAVVIHLESGETLCISLVNDDYNGPEAIVLKQEGKSPVVWS